MINKHNRNKIYNIIFTTNGYYAKLFDVWLLVFILLSCILPIIETIPTINNKYHNTLILFEWTFTLMFTLEYILRVYSSKKRLKYIYSSWGIIDLLAILPTYLTFIYPAIHFFTTIRIIRLIRIFRVFKLSKYLSG